MASISSTLKKINRWWQSGEVSNVFLKEIVRNEYEGIISSLKRERILAIIGPRRVGKSTLLYQTIDYLIKNGVNPKSILFFSGDEPALFTDSTKHIGDVIEAYEIDILEKKLEELNNKIYIIIDEIHFLKDWQLWLKSFYDRKYKIKFIITGSSSTHLFQGSKESLLGRIESVHVLPLLFNEFVRFYAQYKNEASVLSLYNWLPDYSVFDKPIEYARYIIANVLKIEDSKIAVNKVLKEYLVVGGYPEYFMSENLLLWHRQLADDIISKGLFRDIISIYNVKNPEILEKLLYFVAANSGQPHSYTTIAETLGVDFSTISNYLSYLSNAFMVTIVDNYSRNAGKVIRKNKKLYVTDNGISNALLRNEELNEMLEGKLIEQSCTQLARSYAQENLSSIFYFRSGIKEIDIVVDKKTAILPIEVKYRNKVGISDAKYIIEFLKTFNTNEGMVITKDYLDIINNVVFIPFWLIK